MSLKLGAISALDLKKLQSAVAALKAAGQNASRGGNLDAPPKAAHSGCPLVEDQIATAKRIQAECPHRGYIRTDGSIYLECGLCGAPL